MGEETNRRRRCMLVLHAATVRTDVGDPATLLLGVPNLENELNAGIPHTDTVQLLMPCIHNASLVQEHASCRHGFDAFEPVESASS